MKKNYMQPECCYILVDEDELLLKISGTGNNVNGGGNNDDDALSGKGKAKCMINCGEFLSGNAYVEDVEDDSEESNEIEVISW